MSEDLFDVEVRNFEEGDKVTGTVTSVEDNKLMLVFRVANLMVSFQ